MAPYDTYDYPAYWQKRDYEHKSEVMAIREFLLKVPRVRSIIDIGCGYGRLTPFYAFRAKRIILTDPSIHLLQIAKKNLKKRLNIEYLKSDIKSLPDKLNTKKVDLTIMVRVLHHIDNPDQVFTTVSKLLNKKGYFILEFANKIHWKAVLQNFLKGNFIFPIDIFPSDRRSEKKIRNNYISFNNYHPLLIKQKLQEAGFRIIEERSVSNVRSSFLKKHLPLPLLMAIERNLQKTFSKIYFGPSIFVLARKE